MLFSMRSRNESLFLYRRAGFKLSDKLFVKDITKQFLLRLVQGAYSNFDCFGSFRSVLNLVSIAYRNCVVRFARSTFLNPTNNSYSISVTLFIRYTASHHGRKICLRASIDEATGSVILDGISKGLDVIGPNVEQVFYTEMMYSHNLTKNEILERPEEFTEAMSQFFRVGTSLVDRTIGREIVKNFGIPVSPGLTFKTALEIVMKLPTTSPSKKTTGSEYDPNFCKTCQKLGRA